MITVLTFIVVLGLLVFVHEFGHFVVAKSRGMRVEEFGFGFPPRMMGIQRVGKKWKFHGGASAPEKDKPTVYSINWIPLGGFVRIKGEAGEDAKATDSFAARSVLERIGVVIAGVVMNVVLAGVLMSIGFMAGFPQIIEGSLSRYAHVSDERFEIMNVLPKSPAAKAGLEPGDAITSIEGIQFGASEEMRNFIHTHANQSLHFSMRRNGQEKEYEITPALLPETGTTGVGIGFNKVGVVRYPIWLAVPKGAQMTGLLGKGIFFAFGDIIRDLVTGHKVTLDVAGPVGIAVMTGQAARAGWVYLVQFAALLSLNLAVINLFPFPALDGGRLLFLIIEGLRRRPLNQKVEVLIHNIGFTILILLVVAVTYRDITRYGGSIGHVIGRIFN